MPVEIPVQLRRPSDHEFSKLAYHVMDCAFQVHSEFGRFCDEIIYKQMVEERLAETRLEVPITVRFESFSKTYYIDMLAQDAALFEWKAADRLNDQHRGQTLNYLMLCDLPKGKLINVRPEKIEHEFVNNATTPDDRHWYEFDKSGFQAVENSDNGWLEFFVAALRDWGAGLDVGLYEAAISHAANAGEEVRRNVAITCDGTTIGEQRMRVAASGAAFKVTAISDGHSGFVSHAGKLLSHTSLPAIHWVNVTRRKVTVRTLLKQ